MNGAMRFKKQSIGKAAVGKWKRKSSWKKAIGNLSKQYGRKERFRTIFISVAILMVTILFASILLSVGMSVSAIYSYNGIWKRQHMMDLLRNCK